jgi:hypothetical protein
MNKVIFFHGDKGGVGKSFSCSVYLDYILYGKGQAEIEESSSAPPVVIEADPRNPDIYRFLKNNYDVKRIGLLDLKNHEGWMDLADVISEHKDVEIIINLPAGAGQSIHEEIGLLSQVFEEFDRQVWVVWTMSRLLDSVALLEVAMNDFKRIPQVKWLALKNGFFGGAHQVYRWETSDLRKRCIQSGNIEHYLPELHERVVDVVFPETGDPVPFSLALQKETLKFSVRIELERWLKDASLVFDAVNTPP